MKVVNSSLLFKGLPHWAGHFGSEPEKEVIFGDPCKESKYSAELLEELFKKPS
jgi:hypothetical protein